MQKIKQHLSNNKSTYISCCVVFFVLMIMFATQHIWPFGKNTFGIFDLSNQIIPLATHIYDIFEGKASLFYSNRWASGMNMFASLIYFIVSPLYLLMFLGGRSNMIYLINLVVVAYFICMTISINYMMKKLFKLNTIFQVIISLCYCFCGYILQNYTFIVWLNYLVLMPLIVVAFKRLVEKEKYLTFSFLIFAYIISCFGVGTTTMFVLLGIFYLYVLLCVGKDKRAKTLTRLTIALLFAVLISSIVIVPAWLSARLGTRSGQLFDYVFTSEIERGWSKKIMYVILDFAFSTLSVVFAIFSNKKDKFNKFLSIVLVSLVFIHFVDACLMLLCFGINNGYYNRLDFILLTFSILAICKFFVDAQNNAVQVRVAENKKSWIKENWKSLLAITVLVAFAVVFLTMVFDNKFNVKQIAKPIVVHNEVEDDALNILNGVLYVAIPFLLIVLLFKFKQIHYKAMQIAICVLLGCQAVLGGVILANMNFDMETINATSDVVSEYYGDYDKGYGIMKNIAGYYDTSNSSVFTSMLPQKTYDAYSYLGYDTKFNYVVTSRDSGTVFADSLLGVKYRMFGGLADDSCWTTIDTATSGEAKYSLQNFNFSTTGAFLIDQDYEWDWSKNSLENQNKLARAMGADKDIFEIVDLNSIAAGTTDTNIVVNKRNTYQKNGIYNAYAGKTGSIEILTSGENIIFYLTVDEDYYDYLKNSTIDKFVNKNAIYTIHNVTFKFESEGLDLSKIHIAKFDIQNYAEQFEKNKQNQVEIEYYSNGCKFDIDLTENKKLFVSNINIKGMSAKINGKKAKVEDLATGFVGVNLSAGQNSVVVYYKSPILWPSIIVCILCIAIAILVVVLYNKGKLNWLDKIVDKAYLVYGIALLCFLFVFAGVLTVVKMII